MDGCGINSASCGIGGEEEVANQPTPLRIMTLAVRKAAIELPTSHCTQSRRGSGRAGSFPE
jgi:hypothetical protein